MFGKCRRRRPARCGLTTLLAGIVLAAGLGMGVATSASAATVPGDDRLQAQPVGWWTYANLTASDVSAKLQANNARLTDLRVENGSDRQWRFTATMVANSGAYGTGWAWYFNQSKADVDTLLANNSARPISLQRYWNGSSWRYAVVVVSNTGASQREWTLREGTAADIQNAMASLPGYRLAGVSVDACNIYAGCTIPKSHYVAIFEANPEGYVATFHPGKTAAALGAASAGNQLVDLDPNDDGTFNAITYSKPWAAWSWMFDQSIGALAEHAGQHGMRLIDVTSYRKNGKVFYAGIMVDNLTGLSAELRSMYEGKIPAGAKYGFRLKQWNGPTLAALQDQVVFEPASAVKTLIHLHVMKSEQNGLAYPVTPIDYRYTNTPNATNMEASSCPIGAPNVAQIALYSADKWMMQVSDNRMSHGIYDYFKSQLIPVSQTATQLGLTNTTLQLESCDRLLFPDATTLSELSKIYEAGYLRTDFLDAPRRDMFRTSMDTGVWASWFMPMVLEEAQKVGVEKPEVFSKIVNDYSMGKGGGLGADGRVWAANSGLVAVPNDPAGTSVTYYEWGSFVHDAKTSDQFKSQDIQDTNNAVWIEALRPIFHVALVKWKALGG